MKQTRIDRFVQERDQALLSMDRDQILRYIKRWGDRREYTHLRDADEEIFWGSVHKARTAARGLPKAERLKSKAWLAARGLKSWENPGELD